MLYLHGMGHFYPENVITNEFLEELDIGSSSEWILERVGIRTRRTCLPLDYIRQTKNREPREAVEAALYGNTYTGTAAARMAIERSGLKAEDIGMIISGSSAPDHSAPAESSSIAAELGIEVPCFDMTSACSTYGMQVHFLNSMKPEAIPPFVLIVNPENFTRVVDYSKRNDAALLGMRRRPRFSRQSILHVSHSRVPVLNRNHRPGRRSPFPGCCTSNRTETPCRVLPSARRRIA